MSGCGAKRPLRGVRVQVLARRSGRWKEVGTARIERPGDFQHLEGVVSQGDDVPMLGLGLLRRDGPDFRLPVELRLSGLCAGEAGGAGAVGDPPCPAGQYGRVTQGGPASSGRYACRGGQDESARPVPERKPARSRSFHLHDLSRHPATASSHLVILGKVGLEHAAAGSCAQVEDWIDGFR